METEIVLDVSNCKLYAWFEPDMPVRWVYLAKGDRYKIAQFTL